MNRHMKIFTKLIAIVCLLTMNINSFAAVSANDGSAFITKAEFDVLVNTFNEQMDNYEKSLVSKVDGAIANYLASFDNTQTIMLDNYIETAKNASVKNVQFMKFKAPQATKNVDDVIAGIAFYQAYGGGEGDNQNGSGIYSYYGANSVASWTGAYAENRYTNFTGKSEDYTSSYYYAEFPYASKNNYTDWTLKELYRKRLNIKLYANNTQFLSAQLNKTSSTVGKTINQTQTVDVSNYTQPSTANKTLGRVYDDSGPSVYTAQTHNWTNTDSNDKTNNAYLEYNLSGTISGADSSVNYEFRNYYDKDTPYTLQIQAKKEQTTYYGGNPGGEMSLTYKGSAISDSTTGKSGNSNVKFYWKFNKPKIYTLNWANLTSKYWNSVMGKALYKYQGIPITNVKKEGTIKISLTLNNPKSGAYVYAIADKAFPNSDIPETMKEGTYDHILKRGTVSRSGDEKLDLELEKTRVFDKNNGDYIYIKIDPSVDGEIVTVTVDTVYEVIEAN